MIRTEDGHEVQEGNRVYNYYDMRPGTIVPGTVRHMPDPWFDVRHDDGTTAVLNGQRICTMAFARSRGFRDADEEGA